MCYANKESRHGEECAAPGIRHRRGSGGRAADMSLAGTHSAFSVPTGGLKKRLLVAVVQVVEGDAEAQRIDGPAPLALLQVGVLDALEGVALRELDIGIVGTGGAAGDVVAKADEVDGVGGQILDSLLVLAFLKDQAGLVGLGLIAVGDDAGPSQAHAEGLKAHLGKMGDVLLVVVIEIDAHMRRIVVPVVAREHLAIVQADRARQTGKRSAPCGTTSTLAKPRPSTSYAPSHWLAAVAPPHRKSLRKAMHRSFHTLVVVVSVSAQTARRSTATAQVDTSFRTQALSSRHV